MGYTKDISYNQKRILDVLGKGISNKSKIAERLKISRKTVHKHINILKKEGKYGEVTGVTQRGYTTMGYSPQTDLWRYNGVQIFFNLPGNIKPELWNKYRGKALALKNVSYDEENLKHDKIQYFYLKNRHFTEFFNDGIMVFAPNFYGKTKGEADEKMGIWCMHIAEQLKKLTNVDFMRNNEINVSICKCELSKLHDGVAKSLRINNKKVYVRVDNRLRIIFDFSNGIDERETVTAEYRKQDHTVMEGVTFDYITGNADRPSKSKERMDRAEDIIVKITEKLEHIADGLDIAFKLIKEK
ncbi:MAG: HTH domain-containing protein [bacterium]|nr:HTH domain-containing protein [bacterium]MDZ4227887.1 HTH domain-containing protein [Candidatus Levybacteria bacterium]